jgi:AAA family ATP:ADP antiporter
MDFGAILLRGLEREQRIKGALLSGWFFLTVATLWILKPVRVASLLAHLGSTETPYVRLAGVATIGVVVMLYSIALNKLSRIGIVRWSSLLFGSLLVLFWLALRIWGAALGGQRPFVWAVYILVEIYSVTMIGIFWTYTNDVVTEAEANRLYGVIGLGGILGGLAGGAFVDGFARTIGPVHFLLVCAGLCACSAGLGSVTEAVLRPPPRRKQASDDEVTLADGLAGAAEVRKSRYLMLLVAIVIAYEFTATLTDFSVNVIFEKAFSDEVEMTKMYGRIGWIASATAVVAQVVLVPLLLPKKQIALLLPPVAMFGGAVAALLFPVVAAAIVLSAADRGLNYSIQQSVKESLYVPLSDTQKYKTKAFIDMFVDRAAKAGAAFTLIALIQVWGAAARPSLVVALASTVVWIGAAQRLGAHFRKSREAAAKAAAAETAGRPDGPAPLAQADAPNPTRSAA